MKKNVAAAPANASVVFRGLGAAAPSPLVVRAGEGGNCVVVTDEKSGRKRSRGAGLEAIKLFSDPERKRDEGKGKKRKREQERRKGSVGHGRVLPRLRLSGYGRRSSSEGSKFRTHEWACV